MKTAKFKQIKTILFLERNQLRCTNYMRSHLEKTPIYVFVSLMM